MVFIHEAENEKTREVPPDYWQEGMARHEVQDECCSRGFCPCPDDASDVASRVRARLGARISERKFLYNQAPQPTPF